MRKQPAQASLERCRGLAMVEFAVVVPICLMLVLATAELGRAFLQYNALEKCVRDGARYVAGRARKGSTEVVTVSAQLDMQTRNLVVYGNTLGTDSALLPSFTTDQVTVVPLAAAESVTVTASYPYQPLFAFIPAFFYGADVDVSGYVFQAAVTMRAL